MSTRSNGAQPVAGLTIDGLTVDYGRRRAVDGVCSRVGAGEWIGLIGPNGAGKSTVLRAVVGLVRATGTITWGDVAIDGLAPRARARLIAYVPQEPLIPGDMTVFDYVLLGRTPYTSYLGAESPHDRHVVRAVLARLELACFGDRYMGALSGGERQRVVIARALAQEAPMLLLDEPTSALDIGHQQQALELVDQLRRERGLTVVSAMHELSLAGAYADSLTMLDAGRVVASGSASEVLTEQRLRDVYRVNARVAYGTDGTVTVMPVRG